MEFVCATVEQLDAVAALIRRATAALDASGIRQWDARYPSRGFLQDAIAGGALHLLVVDGAVVGAVVLDEWQSPEWAAISWEPAAGAILVIHALAIDPLRQGQGYGAALLERCEQLARARGYARIRLDASSGNPAALRMYERRGYQYRGTVEFSAKPAGHRRYRCYEKRLGPEPHGR